MPFPLCKYNNFCAILTLLVATCVVLISRGTSATSVPSRSFGIESNSFVKDGKPFRYISGSFHYFRALRQKWPDIMHKFKLAGLNTLQTYVEWSSHQPTPAEEYDFSGNLDLFEFLKEASRNDLLVILRPGPFIDAERDMGGLPPWLLWGKPNIQLRTSDLDYNYYVAQWFDYLLPKLVPYLYQNNGPIIMVQVENEYGSFGCDKNYTIFLRNLFRRHLGENTTLFTTDGAGDSYLRCGVIPEVFATVDFGPEFDMYTAFALERKYNNNGPLVNSEYYTGWLDHWQRPHYTSGTKRETVSYTLNNMLNQGANVNLYMFYGGTSFGFKAGANIDNEMIEACPTSYDYDAPLNEAGDPTEKYWEIRRFISRYSPVPEEKPENSTKGDYGNVQLKPCSYLLHPHLLPILDASPVTSSSPLSFEELKLSSGFVLYETTISFLTSDPVMLFVPNLKDRAYVSVDGVAVGILSRTERIYTIPISIANGGKLSILVENIGRPCYGPSIGESKGLGSGVQLGSRFVQGWKHYRLGELNARVLEKYARTHDFGGCQGQRCGQGSTVFYYGNFILPLLENNTGTPFDTFVQFNGWSRGILWVNGFNLGRYWPLVGPQQTLYLPGSLLNPPPATNTFMVFELENPPDDCIPTLAGSTDFNNRCYIQLTNVHVLNSDTPYNATSENIINS